jgi:nucleoside-diphosphate-sugar epimerase
MDKMERILITGGTGFIGQEITNKLTHSKPKRFEIHTLQRKSDIPAKTAPDVIVHQADITSYESVSSIVRDVKPDYVLHLAAITAVSYSYDHFKEVTATNYDATVNLAEACHREAPNLKQFIFSSTSEVYGQTLSNKDGILTEESKLSPTSPYAVAKVASENYLTYMGMAYNFPFTIIRTFNTYGRKNNSNFFIERTITQMLNGGDVVLGDPTIVRDWVYIEDHIEAYMKTLGNPKMLKQTVQICTGRASTLKETAGIIANLTGFKGQVHWNAVPPRPLDVKFLRGDNSRAKSLLGWSPRFALEEGLKLTVEHWKKQNKLQ